MIRYIKALGLVAFAALAMSATFASAASAEEPGVLTAGDTDFPKQGEDTHTPATITGTQYDEPGPEWNYFEAAGAEINCDNAHFSGTDPDGTAKEISLTAEYTECQAEGQPATVTMNGCSYTFTQPITTGETFTGTADLVCPEGKAIVVHVYLFGNSTSGSHAFNVCTIEVFPKEGTEQELGGAITYSAGEFEGKDDLTVAADIEGISFNDKCNSNSGDNAIYKNTVTVTAVEDEKEPHEDKLDLWISKE